MNKKMLRTALALVFSFTFFTMFGCDNPFVGDTINNYNHNGDGDDSTGNEQNTDTDAYTNSMN